MIREICWDSQLSVRTGDLLFLLLEPDPSRDRVLVMWMILECLMLSTVTKHQPFTVVPLTTMQNQRSY